MKRILISTLTLVASAGISAAGIVSTGGGKLVTSKNPPPTVSNCADCFAQGSKTFSIYAAGVIPNGSSHVDDGIGGGIGLGYSICENFAIELDATWVENDSTIHAFTASAVLRQPIESLCIAPYIIGGGGVSTNSATQGIYHAGGGLDMRLSGCTGIFAEGRYVWADETSDYTLVRAGIKLSF